MNLDATLARARALTSSPCDHDLWRALTDAVDACAPGDVGALVDAIGEDAIAWADAGGVSRLAPDAWLEQMAGGDYSSRDRLVGAMSFGALTLTAGKIVKALASPELTSLRRLDLGKLKLSTTFWKKLRTLPSTKTLERLSLNRIIDRDEKGILGEHHLGALRRVDILLDFNTKPDPMRTLFTSELFQGVEVLGLECHDLGFRSLLWALSHADAATSLRKLVLKTSQGEWISEILAHECMAQLDEVSYAMHSPYYDTTNLLGASSWDPPAGPPRVDLSELTIDPANLGDEMDAAGLLEVVTSALRIWTPPTATRQVALGPWWTEENAATLRSKGVEPLREIPTTAGTT